ncbi:hypothetical protein PINS_up000739 [Pythium insidiosum]|nr:hypothetical protein PINS_up000739 [Pythium insidiosum]
MTASRLCLLATAALAAASSLVHADPASLGGWRDVPVQKQDTDRLATVLAQSSSYRTNSPVRLCYTNVVRLQQQVVAGTNFKYDVDACEVPTAEDGHGKCAVDCAAQRYSVVVFEQTWTNTLFISDIAAAGNEARGPVTGGFSPVEVEPKHKELLAKALKANASICYVDVLALDVQVVSGLNYKFDITTCDVAGGEGKCASACASPKRATALVYEQPWTSTLKLTSVTEVPSPGPITGGYTRVPVEQEDKDRLQKVLQASANYNANSPLRLCYVAVYSLEAQVVSGFNFQYDVKACVVPTAEAGQGKCASQCSGQRFKVTVFEQPWTNTLQVRGIAQA